MPSFEPLPKSRRRPDWRTGPNVSRGGKLIDVEILGSIIAEESWSTPSLQASWVNFGSGEEVARYRKDSNGIVHVRGVIKSGTTTSGTTIFTLPAGYRPDSNFHVALVSNDAFASAKITSAGLFVARAGWNATWVSINCSFPT